MNNLNLNTLKDQKRYYPMCHRKQGDILLMGNASEDKMKEYEKLELIDSHAFKQSAIKWIQLWKRQLTPGIWIEIYNNRLIVESDYLKKSSDNTLVSYLSAFIMFFDITDKDLLEDSK